MRWAVATALLLFAGLLFAGESMALGLGQIQVKSKRNQPLLAEIPIISTTPGELVSLQARLASPETFRRVGLEPPSGIAHDLQFSLGNDAQGRPVIRVSTTVPVDQPALSFLVEVDWGKGRLVREYAALVDAPVAASSTMQLAMQAPQAAEENRIKRPELPVAEIMPKAEAKAEIKPEIKPEPKPEPKVEPKPAPAPQTAPTGQAKQADKPDVQQADVHVARPAAAPSAMYSANAYGPVKAGESLSHVASRVALRQDYSLEQVMLALLQENPDAFIGGDPNRLRKGAVLRIPGQETVAKTDATQARREIYQQVRQQEIARQAVRQPGDPAIAQTAVATEAKVSAPAPASDAGKKPASSTASNSVKNAPPAATKSAGTQAQDARLQIVAAVDTSKATGARTGTNVGGEGSMLQHELRQRDEDIAAKSVEITELKERVAALEKLKDDQQQLIQLKDTELAAVQQRLAEANKAQALQQAATVKEDAAPVAVTEVAKTDGNMTPYVWGGVGVVVLALLAWLLAGRGGQQKKPVRRNVFDPQPAAPVAQQDDVPVPAEASEPEALEPAEASELVIVAEPTSISEPEQVLASEPDEVAIEPAPVSVPENTVSTVEEQLIDVADVPQPTTPTALPEWYSGWVKTDVEPPQSVHADAAVSPVVDAIDEADTVHVAPSSSVTPALDDASDEELERKLEWMLETEPKAEASAELTLALEPKITAVTEPELELALEEMLATDDLPQEKHAPIEPLVEHAVDVPTMDVAATELSLEPPAQASTEQRFKMVHAFLEMGDEYSAQQMLLELLTDEDKDVSAEAERMLSKLAN